MNAAQLLVRCLENEGVEYVFGVPGEENIDVMDALIESPIRFITTRHEQGAAFMADVYGRLTGKAGVCLSTLGPGATNLITGVADANMDRAPVVAIAGQGAMRRMHKESHQILDLVQLFQPITKYAVRVNTPEIVPEAVRKAFKVAQTEKPGACFIEFPEDVADQETAKQPIPVQVPAVSLAPDAKVEQAAAIISAAACPVILAGNGVIRQGAAASLASFAEVLRIPVANTFMAKGVFPFSHPLAIGTIGLKARDLPWFAFEQADVVICVGYDMVEYHAENWNPNGDKTIIHVDTLPAEVDECYHVACGVLGDIGAALRGIALRARPQSGHALQPLRDEIIAEREAYGDDEGFPLKPQKILWDLRQVLRPDDVVVSDVGAHKMWTAIAFRTEQPNTCIISNGFASMGIALPGAIAARLAYPGRRAVALTGDAGFMMNSQEIETALREGTPLVVLIWNDAEYGLITWHQLRTFGRKSHVEFTNPDFVQYARSFGAKGYRIEKPGDLVHALETALADNTVSIIDCPVDYSENMKLTKRLASLTSPL
jgi:acetolactate synthase-1/2/3 large subunit